MYSTRGLGVLGFWGFGVQGLGFSGLEPSLVTCGFGV